MTDVSALLMDQIPFWVLVPLVIVMVVVPAAGGFWLGRRTGQHEGKSQGPTGTKVGATLALLAFMLAFTFNMAATRYDARRHLVSNDAIAIEALYRRTPLLPGEHGPEVRQLLREFVDIRLEMVENPQTRATSLARSEELYRELWTHAEAIAIADSTTWKAAWFIESLSSLTEVSRRRVWAGFYSRVPVPIWMALGVITVLSMLAMGYQAGLSRTLRIVPMAALSLAFAIVFALIADLDRPQDGLIRTSQNPVSNVQQIIQQETLSRPAL